MTRWEELRKDWLAFHKARPEVWKQFCEFTFDRIKRGFQNYSSDAIFHRVRWEMAIPAYRKGKEFKLNDHYTAFYSRAFMETFPEHDGFFRTRDQPSRWQPAVDLPPLGPEYLDSR